MLSTNYLYLPEKYIENKEDFYSSGITEASKIRNLINICQRLFVTTSRKIKLYLLGDKDVYRIDVWDNKTLVARLYYLPKQYRLDIYDPDEPLFMWKSKKCVYKKLSRCLEYVKTESLFLPLISIL